MKDRGIGDESDNPTKCSEVTDGVARKSEGIAPNFRFCALYGKLYAKDVLAFAYENLSTTLRPISASGKP